MVPFMPGSDSLIQGYDEVGYVIVRNAIDADLATEASEHIKEIQRRASDSNALHFSFHDNLDAFWYRLISDQRLLSIAEKFIGPDIALFASAYFSKQPFSRDPVNWHQDGSYWPLEPVRVVTLWLAIDRATRENGCLRVIPGTHRMELQQNVQHSQGGVGVDLACVDESRAVNIELNPGDVSIHHPNLIHGSEANNSDKRRCGLTIRYIPTSTRITTPDWPMAFLLKGRAIAGINKYLTPPACQAAFQQSSRAGG